MNSRLETRNTGLTLARCLLPLRIGWGEGLRVRCFFLFPTLLLTSVLCLPPSVHAATFTTNAVISETNLA